MNDINNKDDLYNILEIKPDASLNSIKKSYKKLSLKYHPDKQIKSKLSVEEKNNQFIKIRNAYEILSDPVKRQKYDREKLQKMSTTNIFSLNNLSGAIHDFKSLLNSKEYIILMNILDNKVKQSLLNNVQLDKFFIQINQMNIEDVLYTINNFKLLDIEIIINFSLKQLYNNEYEKIKYNRLTKDVFEELIFPIDSMQIYEGEGETFNNLSGNFIVKININSTNYNFIDYQILDKDLYAIINNSQITNHILKFPYLDDNIYEFDITQLEKNNTDFGNLYYIENMGLPYYNTDDNEINVKKCEISRGKLNLLII
jgi:DnaJ-class molecular chaperone